jgi:NitT/TauT family transport system substrate-binding protein
MIRALRRLTAVAALAAMGVLTAGCATPPGKTADSTGGSSATVRVGVDSFTIGAQFFVGQDKGYFTDEGLTVSPQVFATGIAAIDGILGGQLDVAPALDFATMSRIGTGRLQIVGALASPEAGFHKLAYRGTFGSAADLKGKRIGYVPGTAEEFVTRNFLKLNGLTEGDVELLTFDGLFELVSAIKAGRVDAAWIWGQGTDQVKSDSAITLPIDDREAQAGGPTIYLVTTKEYAAANRATLASLFKALDRASSDIQSDTAGSAAIVATHVKGDKEVLAGALPTQHFEVGMTPEAMERLEVIKDFAEESGAFKVPNDIKGVLTLDAIREALPEKVTVD